MTSTADLAHELSARFGKVRSTTRALCEGLTAEDCMVQSMDDASPVKWHLAHTTWFFEQFVLLPLGLAPFAPAWGELFNSYYVGAGPRHPRARRGGLSRPGLDQVWRYREHVEVQIARVINSAEPQTLDLVRLGLEHEQQHQELILTDLKHHFASQPLAPLYAPMAPAATSQPTPLGFVSLSGGLSNVGDEGNDFCFDNERPRHKVWIEPFALADRLVTEGEYLEFMQDGGYEEPLLWLSSGWDARQQEGWRAPLYWQRDGDDWSVVTLGGRRAPRKDTPVCHVGHYEADAFARWARARLPTEPEWEFAATAAGDSNALLGTLLEDGAFHPRPAAQCGGMRQMLGDCWEWTGSAYLPYPGYRTPPGTVGEYNGKFMSGQMVLKGGSAATPRSHIRASYRNFFPASARWQFSGIRLARDS